MVKASSTHLLRQIEQGIQFGKWVFIENLSTYIDPNLDPILNQQITKHGG